LTKKPKSKDLGILFHAKHAYMPNNLGYCGPDDRGSILAHLEESKGSESLAKTLKGFEAAYPFLELIARSSGKNVFDYSVPEAYWVGNELLGRVSPADFYDFSRTVLGKGDGVEVKRAFKRLGPRAIPHHSFYVMSTFAGSSLARGPSLSKDGKEKIESMINNCRISWGQVIEIQKKALVVRGSKVALSGRGLRLAAPSTVKAVYDSEIESFKTVRPGDWVTMHWGFACEVVTPRQVRNLSKYTELDMKATDALLASRETRPHR
jgi:hypothetical protein